METLRPDVLGPIFVTPTMTGSASWTMWVAWFRRSTTTWGWFSVGLVRVWTFSLDAVILRGSSGRMGTWTLWALLVSGIRTCSGPRLTRRSLLPLSMGSRLL